MLQIGKEFVASLWLSMVLLMCAGVLLGCGIFMDPDAVSGQETALTDNGSIFILGSLLCIYLSFVWMGRQFEKLQSKQREIVVTLLKYSTPEAAVAHLEISAEIAIYYAKILAEERAKGDYADYGRLKYYESGTQHHQDLLSQVRDLFHEAYHLAGTDVEIPSIETLLKR